MLSSVARPAISGLSLLRSSFIQSHRRHVKRLSVFSFNSVRGIAGREPQDFNDGLMPEVPKDDDDEDAIYDRDFMEMKLEDYESIYENDPSGELKKSIQTILEEYEYLKYNSMGRVPANIDLIDMKRILDEAPTPRVRDKLFHFLYKRDMARRAFQNRKEREKRDIAARKIKKEGLRTGLTDSSGELTYGLWHNTLFCRISDGKMKMGRSSSRLITAALYGRKLVFDFDFEREMVPWISRNTMEQVQESYGLNRFGYKEPFDIWFCNFNPESNGGQFLASKALKNLYDGSLITVKNDCFTNYFDKSRLVYLSPNAREKLGDISRPSDDVYIIGAYNDKGTSKPLTYRKAEALGIRCRSLPIDCHVQFSKGSKSLCVNHVTGILLEVIANGGDWREALIKHIPKRKIKPMEVLMEEEARRNHKLRQKLTAKFSIRDEF